MNLSKKRFLRPIFLSFTCFYLLSMLLCTYLKTAEYKKTYQENVTLQLEQTAFQIYHSASLNTCNGIDLSDNQIRQLKYYLTDIKKETAYNPASMALYDSTGKLVAQTTNLLTANEPYPAISGEQPLNQYYDLNEYLTDEELWDFASYCHISYDLNSQGSTLSDQSIETYRLTAKVNADNWDLTSLRIYRTQSMIFMDSSGYTVDGNILNQDLVWSWNNQAESPESEVIILENSPLSALFPFIEDSIDAWLNWNNNAALHDYPKEIRSSYDSSSSLTMFSEDSISADSVYPVVFAGDMEQENIYMLVYRSEDHSLTAALDYMKYIYIFGFVIALLCMLFVWVAMEKVLKKQRLLEENRRDFTNAIAHELKTPLGIIRGFSENLKENIKEEKKDYYLEQIIGQTEEMDQMVQEMIYISKLDSDQLSLHKETLSLLTLLEAQFDKLDSLLQEKNLALQIQCEEDFIVNGDKSYLEKALWNLASNAVSYSRTDGTIWILCTSTQLLIENSGKLIEEQDLPHVFDMFYTGVSRRSSEGKHLGLGLYLAKKIFNLHHLEISIQNAEERVQVCVHI